MPTPSPIIVARVGDTVAKVVAAASSPSSPRPQTTQMRAVIRGSRAARRLPKPISSTRTATPKPMASLTRSFALGRASSPSEPPYSTSAPADRSGRTAESTPSRYPEPRLEGCSLNRTVMYAVFPSAESGPTSGPPVLLGEHVGEFLQAADHRRHLAAQPAEGLVRVVHHHLAAVAAGRGGVFLQD